MRSKSLAVLNMNIFKKYLRISSPIFDILVEKWTPFIQKMDTNMRSAIPVGPRLEATLLFLIEGLPYSRLQYHTRISECALGRIIPVSCEAIFKIFGHEYLKVIIIKICLYAW